MRLPIAAAVLAIIAFPAAAQRVDDRVDDVRITPDGFACRSHAMPELLILHGPDGANRRGSVAYAAAEDDGHNDLRLVIAFAPDAERRHKTGAAFAGFYLRTTGSSDKRPVTAAVLAIDGVPDAARLRLTSDRFYAPSYSITAAPEDRVPLAERLGAARTAELALLEAGGQAVRRFTWDIRRLDDAREMFLLTGPRCLHFPAE